MSFFSRAAASFNLDHALCNREMQMQQQQGHIFRQRLFAAKNLYQRNLTAHYGCINALEFSNGGQFLASGGDDRRVLLWHVDQALANIGEPRVMYGEHASNIFCLGFDTHNSYVFSGGNDDMVIQHDLATGKNLSSFLHDGPVYGLSVDKTSANLLSVATEHGEILVYDLRADKTELKAIAKFRTPFNAVEFHPLNGNFLATANAKRGAMLWDIRHHAQPLCQYNIIPESPSCMSVRFNCNGTLLLTLHRRLPPMLYSPNSPEPLCTFYHHEYFNSCTMKSCTFAGPEDELVVSGSDNFNMFIWRLDDVDLEQKDQWIDTPPLMLTGHRSIVNQVRYNRQRCLLASSGVEKIIKFWSPFDQQGWQGSLLHKSTTPYCTRTLYRNATEHVTQDFSTRNTDEDPVMLAFFDRLVQRELESWHTNPTGTFVSSNSSGSSEESFSSTLSENTQDTPNVSELSWQSHPNRIFYLIAKKRRALLQLALKCASTGGRLPVRVRGKTPVNSEQLLASVLGETNQAAMRARISEWLEETHRQIGDDEAPTTSAEAAARERWRRALWSSEEEREEQPTVSEMPTPYNRIGSFRVRFEALQRKHKLQRLRLLSRKRRRNMRARRHSSDEDHDSINTSETESMDCDNDADDTAGDSNASVSSVEHEQSMQLSEAPGSSTNLRCDNEPETNNNSQMTTNNNTNNNNNDSVITKANSKNLAVACNGDNGAPEPANI